MHIYHVASNAPVAAILRPARTPKGSDRRGLLSFSTMEEVDNVQNLSHFQD